MVWFSVFLSTENVHCLVASSFLSAVDSVSGRVVPDGTVHACVKRRGMWVPAEQGECTGGLPRGCRHGTGVAAPCAHSVAGNTDGCVPGV